MTRAEYNQCVDDYADGVYRFILKNIRDEDKADDIVQDAFVKMWEKVETIRFDKAKSYLFTAAYHTMIDAIRKDKRLVEQEESHHNILTSENDYSDLSEILHEAMDTLPEIQKSVILLRDYEGYSYEEIGEITKLNESQVKVYIYRARKALKTYIGSLDRVI
ncbi:MAG: RNA polymerase sigma factor [Bacteroidota bacterium]|nr:RNA polymerase sigma factor [Bacteroidota bacterium]